MKLLSSLSTRVRLLARPLLLLGGTVLGLALLIVLLRSVNLDQLGSDYASVDYRYLVVAIGPFVVNLLLRVPRWSLLFGEDAPNWDTLFGAMNVGYAISTLLPLRLGEIVRAYWIRDRTQIGMVQTLSTIALERVADGVTVLIMFLVVVPTVAFPGELLGPALTAGALFVAALLAMVALAYGSRRHDRFPGSLLRRMETGRWAMAGRALRQMVAGVRALGSRRSVALLVVYTVLIWGTHALLIWLVMQAFHLDVPFAGAVLTSAVLSLGMAVPSSPGYVGVWDYLFVVTAGLYGVHKTPALAAALAFHAIAFVPVTLIGLVYIARAGLETTMHMVQSGRPDGQEAAVAGGEGRMRGTGTS